MEVEEEDSICVALDAGDLQVGAWARISGHYAAEYPEPVRIAAIRLDKHRFGGVDITIAEPGCEGLTDGFGLMDVNPLPRHRINSTTDLSKQLEERDAEVARLRGHALAMSAAITRPDTHDKMLLKAMDFIRSPDCQPKHAEALTKEDKA